MWTLAGTISRFSIATLKNNGIRNIYSPCASKGNLIKEPLRALHLTEEGETEGASRTNLKILAHNDQASANALKNNPLFYKYKDIEKINVRVNTDNNYHLAYQQDSITGIRHLTPWMYAHESTIGLIGDIGRIKENGTSVTAENAQQGILCSSLPLIPNLTDSENNDFLEYFHWLKLNQQKFLTFLITTNAQALKEVRHRAYTDSLAQFFNSEISSASSSLIGDVSTSKTSIPNVNMPTPSTSPLTLYLCRPLYKPCVPKGKIRNSANASDDPLEVKFYCQMDEEIFNSCSKERCYIPVFDVTGEEIPLHLVDLTNSVVSLDVSLHGHNNGTISLSVHSIIKLRDGFTSGQLPLLPLYHKDHLSRVI